MRWVATGIRISSACAHPRELPQVEDAHRLITKPTDDFLLEYELEAVEHIIAAM
jgi:hypothetical protein